MKIYPLLIALSLTAVSCSLDENPKDGILKDETYPNAKELYMNTVATLYNYIGGHEDGQGLQGTCRGIYDLQTFASDEAMIPTRGGDWFDGGIWQDLYTHDWDAGHEMINNSWLYLYKVITLCNYSMEQLSLHANLITQARYNEYISEIRALRAIYYWYLLDLFANVPIIVIHDISMNDVLQSKRKEVFDFCVNELQAALPDLSYEHSNEAGDYYGRVTKPVAYFVLAKLMLNAEVYCDNDWTDGVRPNGSDMEFKVADKTMNAWEATIYYCGMLSFMHYRLEDEYTNNFVVRNERSQENIWTIPMDKDLYSTQQQTICRSYHYRHAAAYGFTGKNGSCATLRTLEIFDYGKPEQDKRFAYCYWANDVVDLDNKPIPDRTGKPLRYYPEEVKMEIIDPRFIETAGARMKKYEIDKNATKEGRLMDNDIVLFRYADVLLMKAEAYLRNGNQATGQNFFDNVRARAEMPLRELTFENLLDERLLELCWEGWRRQDLIRFGQYESLFDGDDSQEKVDEKDGHTTVFPIPSDALKGNLNFKQNPGY